MHPDKKKLLIGAGVVLVVLWLASKAKAAAGGTAGQAAAVDPNQALAQQLTAARSQQQAQLDYSAAAVAQNEANTLSQFNFFKQIAADPAYACPNGGRPRWIAGQGPGCIEKRTGAITLGSLLSTAEQAYQVFAGGGGAGRSTPPTGGNRTPSSGGTPSGGGGNSGVILASF